MTIFITSDLHLTDRPRDAYRFDLFKWIEQQQKKYNPRATFILGDITDKKDKHSSELVNKLVGSILMLKPPVFILKGNHDYISSNNPFFKFLNNIDGIKFVTNVFKPWDGLWMVPHCQTETEFGRIVSSITPRPDILMCHAVFDGALAETGTRLTGFRQAHIDQLRPRVGVYAGDVHRPQRAANVTYVGAPYHIKFGDNFDPRCLLITNGKPTNLYFETVRKWTLTVRDPDDFSKLKQLMPGDQVKLTVELAREEVVDWKTHRQQILDAAKAKGLEVFGVDLKINSGTAKKVKHADVNARTPHDVLVAYCRNENVPQQIKQVGETLLGGSK